MVLKPLRPCNATGCNELTNDRYCKNHKDMKHERHRYYDKYKRDKEASFFYKSVEWVRVRLQALMRDHNLCQHCLKDKRVTMAEMVDHIIPIRVNWSLRLTLSNLQSLCNACHAVKTAEDKGKYGGKV